MRRTKSGTALFDLLNDEQAQKEAPISVPEWWSSRASGSAQPPAPAAPPNTEVGAVELAARMNEGTAHAVPFMEVEDGRIRISLTSVSTAVAVFAGLVIVLGAFELGRNQAGKGEFRRGVDAGRASFQADTLSEIEAARRQPPATELVQDLLLQPAGHTANRTGGGSGRARWIRGHTYIVVQEFPRGQTDAAARAQAYLLERGLSAAKIAYPSGSVQLITTQGFNRSDPTQRAMADKLLAQVRTLGASYFSSGGGYRMEGYFKTLKSDAW